MSEIDFKDEGGTIEKREQESVKKEEGEEGEKNGRAETPPCSFLLLSLWTCEMHEEAGNV